MKTLGSSYHKHVTHFVPGCDGVFFEFCHIDPHCIGPWLCIIRVMEVWIHSVLVRGHILVFSLHGSALYWSAAMLWVKHVLSMGMPASAMIYDLLLCFCRLLFPAPG